DGLRRELDVGVAFARRPTGRGDREQIARGRQRAYEAGVGFFLVAAARNGLAPECRRDADQLDLIVDDRAAGISARDRGVGLDVIAALRAADARPTFDFAVDQGQPAAADVGITEHPQPLTHLDLARALLRQRRPRAGRRRAPRSAVEIHVALDEREIDLGL